MERDLRMMKTSKDRKYTQRMSFYEYKRNSKVTQKTTFIVPVRGCQNIVLPKNIKKYLFFNDGVNAFIIVHLLMLYPGESFITCLLDESSICLLDHC